VRRRSVDKQFGTTHAEGHHEVRDAGKHSPYPSIISER
jgi:hypothetical protein